MRHSQQSYTFQALFCRGNVGQTKFVNGNCRRARLYREISRQPRNTDYDVQSNHRAAKIHCNFSKALNRTMTILARDFVQLSDVSASHARKSPARFLPNTCPHVPILLLSNRHVRSEKRLFTCTSVSANHCLRFCESGG